MIYIVTRIFTDMIQDEHVVESEQAVKKLLLFWGVDDDIEFRLTRVNTLVFSTVDKKGHTITVVKEEGFLPEEQKLYRSPEL